MPGEPFLVILFILFYLCLYFSRILNYFSQLNSLVFFLFSFFFREPKIVNGPEILDKYVGESEANIRKVDPSNFVLASILKLYSL
jgi:hypothetical protein